MTSATHRDEFTATLYVGVELSKREWLLTMSAGPGHPVQRARVAPGAVPAITNAVGRAAARVGLPAGVAVRSCSEAGFDGFWPVRVLRGLGWTHLVVDSSSIEVPRRPRSPRLDRPRRRTTYVGNHVRGIRLQPDWRTWDPASAGFDPGALADCLRQGFRVWCGSAVRAG